MEACGSEPFVCIVLPVQQPVFGSTGHDPVWFIGAFGHQIINERADVAQIPGKYHGRLALEFQSGVDASHKALDCSLFVARGAIELTRSVEALDGLALQSGKQGGGVYAVVLNGVGRAHQFGMLQPWDGVQQILLHLFRQAGGESLEIQLFCV